MAANPPQPPQAPVAFARTPAFATDRGIINYNTREGNTTFYKNVRGYYGTTDSDKFNAQPEGLKNFLEELMQRIDEADWMDLFMIPVDNNEPDGDALFFPKAYGMFTLAHRIFGIASSQQSGSVGTGQHSGTNEHHEFLVKRCQASHWCMVG
jgi:hypothetical protein